MDKYRIACAVVAAFCIWQLVDGVVSLGHTVAQRTQAIEHIAKDI